MIIINFLNYFMCLWNWRNSLRFSEIPWLESKVLNISYQDWWRLANFSTDAFFNASLWVCLLFCVSPFSYVLLIPLSFESKKNRNKKKPLESSKLQQLWCVFVLQWATRKAYGVALAKLGHANDRVIALDGDTKNSTFSELFKKEHPSRYIECYIAEQNMVTVPLGSLNVQCDHSVWATLEQGSNTCFSNKCEVIAAKTNLGT